MINIVYTSFFYLLWVSAFYVYYRNFSVIKSGLILGFVVFLIAFLWPLFNQQIFY